MKKIIKNLTMFCVLSNLVTINAQQKFGTRNTIQLQEKNKVYLDKNSNCKLNLYDLDTTVNGQIFRRKNLIKTSDLAQIGIISNFDEKERELIIGIDPNESYQEIKKQESKLDTNCKYVEDKKVYKKQKSDIRVYFWGYDGVLYETLDANVAGDTVFIEASLLMDLE